MDQNQTQMSSFLLLMQKRYEILWICQSQTLIEMRCRRLVKLIVRMGAYEVLKVQILGM